MSCCRRMALLARLFALVALGFGPVAALAGDAEDRAVEAVKKLGGSIVRNTKAPGNPVTSVFLTKTKVTDAGLKELAALKRLLYLNLEKTSVTDAGLKQLTPLKELRTLYLAETKVTDAGLKELTAFTKLQNLGLGGTRVTDAGVKQLAAVQGLKELSLRGTPVTGVGLKPLANLKDLQSLHLCSTHLPDADLKELAVLKNLRKLCLAWTRVSGAGLKHLAALPALQSLDLSGAKLTDADLKALAALKRLQQLNLENTAVTDRGLKELAALKGLRSLNLRGTRVTAAGVQELQKKLPGCWIRPRFNWFGFGHFFAIVGVIIMAGVAIAVLRAIISRASQAWLRRTTRAAPGSDQWQRAIQEDVLRLVNSSDRWLSVVLITIGCCFLLALAVACAVLGWLAVIPFGLGGFVVLGVVGAGLTNWIVALAVRSFNERFPEGGAERPLALEVLAGLNSPNKMPEKLRVALGVPIGPQVSPEEHVQAGLDQLAATQQTPPSAPASPAVDLSPLHLRPPALSSAPPSSGLASPSPPDFIPLELKNRPEQTAAKTQDSGRFYVPLEPLEKPREEKSSGHFS
jgi:internalin A